MKIEKIFNLIRRKVPDAFVDIIQNEYKEIKISYVIEDLTKIGTHTGKFCEIISSLLCYNEFHHKDDLNKINFDNNINKLINSPKPNSDAEIMRLLVPRLLRTLYTIRSKKHIAHIKDYNPQLMDLKFFKISVDWILTQILLVYFKVQDDEILKYLDKISYEDIKLVERFEDGDIIFGDPSLTFSEKILFVLYDHYNDGRTSRDKIYQILKPKNKSYISTYIIRLKNQNLIHENNKGVKLTKFGIPKAREVINKLNIIE